MPSQPPDDLGWNFSPVFDLIGSDVHDVGSPILRSQSRSSIVQAEGGVGLGNFWKLYESLGMTAEAPALPLPPLDESEASNSDEALLPSPVLAAVKTPSVYRLEPSALPNDTTIKTTPGTTKKQRRKLRRLAERSALEEQIAKDEEAVELKTSLRVATDLPREEQTQPAVESPTKPPRTRSNTGAKIKPATPVPSPTKSRVPQTPVVTRPTLSKRGRSAVAPVTPQPQPALLIPTPYQNTVVSQHNHNLQLSQATASISSGLFPRNVRPVTLPRPPRPVAAPVQSHIPSTPTPAPLSGYFTPRVRAPVNIRSQTERHMHLFEKLIHGFPEERKWLYSPRQLVNESTRSEGVHIFVDASNIMIGFKDMLRSNGIPMYDMSFDSLALIMERRRPVAKRVFVGSHREANPLPQITKLVETSKAVGYECNVQEQVYIAREESQKRKFFNDVNKFGWQRAIQKRSGSGSDSETGPQAAPKTHAAPKWVEQGVDELLHLKMCQSLLDTEEPSTMVLATGDGAEAEMSDGFLAHVERALRIGWKVELVTWRQQTNGGYKRKTFRQKWGEQFAIIELDEFLEDLLDTP